MYQTSSILFPLHLTSRFLSGVFSLRHIFRLFSLLHSLTVQEEIVDNSSEPIQPCVLSIAIPPSPPDNRRTSIRQQQRRTFQNTKDSSGPLKKRTRFDFDYNSNFNIDNATNGDNSPIPIEQESRIKMKKEKKFKEINLLIFR